MTPDIAQLLREWDRDVLNGPTSYVGEGEFIDFLATQLFDSFEPAAGAQHPEFGSRLRDWLSCEQDEHYKQKMVQLASRILFFGAKEFEALYRATLPRSVYPWLVNELGLMLDSPNLDAQLQNGIRTTWFTGVTESMRLATFYHVNNIEGVDWRLDWHGAIKGNVSIGRLEEYMAKHGLTRVVVLEDFAGSGTQIREAADLFCQLGKSIPILVAPFFACRGAVNVGAALQSNHANIKFTPLVEIDGDCFIPQQVSPTDTLFQKNIRDLAEHVHAKVVGSGWTQNYGPFGFGQEGGLVVMHTNCPDNCLPMIHHNSDGPWKALFPRSSRL